MPERAVAVLAGVAECARRRVVLLAGCTRSRNPAAIDAVYKPDESKAVCSVRGAPRSAEVCFRRSHIGLLEELPGFQIPIREDLPLVFWRRSVMKTTILSSA